MLQNNRVGVTGKGNARWETAASAQYAGSGVVPARKVGLAPIEQTQRLNDAIEQTYMKLSIDGDYCHLQASFE